MAVKVWDGFDHYGSGVDFQARVGFLQWTVAQFASATPVTGRNGYGKAMAIGGQGFNLEASYGQRVASAFIGFAFSFFGTGASTFNFNFVDSVTNSVQCTVQFNQSGHNIQAYQGATNGTLLGTSANNAWAEGAWHYLEIWPTIDNATGSIKVYIDGQLVLNLTGQNTRTSGNNWWDTLRLNASISTVVTIDDHYYGDTTAGPGSNPWTSPLGDVRVDTLFATANQSVQFSPLALTNWQEVSEIAMDGDTSYNFSSTAGNEDLFTFGPLTGVVLDVVGVQVTGAYRKDDAGARKMKNALKSGSTEQYGTANPISSTGYSYYTDQWILDPNTGLNWSTTAVNNLLAGYNLDT